MDRDARRDGRWRSAHDILRDWERYEMDEWARLTGGRAIDTTWPPRMSRTSRMS